MQTHGRGKALACAGPSTSSEAIDAFEHGLGLSIRGFKKACAFAQKDAALHLDNVRTAFGTACTVPDDFVPPFDNNNALLHDTTNPNLTYLHERCPKPAKQRPQSAAPRRSGGTQPKPKSLPVDFVYDIDIRKQLRTAIDAERRDLLRATQAREALLRDANQWLPNSRPDKKALKQENVAWSTPRRHKPQPWERKQVPPVGVAMELKQHDEVVWSAAAPTTSKKARPKSAVNRRNPVAENVHFASWQTTSYHQDVDKLNGRRQHRRTSQA
ncbi:hypothetical protein H310_08029 [Aphanomyces invadans]|uniref:Uncharacterized protein n=1 Tax=Aphanomyces invadans TaxID=157072 RepID=A0A024U107_9STRA|nr:hypothetical protein H310_08029 [Aphanomyces invadans]ETV99297.1 hypothetical protein H310_08029 [Aphanomyces invadans]|eukprot:XP_008871853.1 hypothetical protein H310_08029 [Aphanomyces invadans]